MSQLPPPPQPPRSAVLANLVGLLLLVIGVIGLNVAAWLASLPLGLATTSLTLSGVGFLGMTREA